VDLRSSHFHNSSLALLRAGATWDGGYGDALCRCIAKAHEFGARALVVSLGVDTLKGDPVATNGAGFGLELGVGASGTACSDFLQIGACLRGANLPTVFVQEGGYDMDRLGRAVADVLTGFCDPTTVV